MRLTMTDIWGTPCRPRDVSAAAVEAVTTQAASRVPVKDEPALQPDSTTLYAALVHTKSLEPAAQAPAPLEGNRHNELPILDIQAESEFAETMRNDPVAIANREAFRSSVVNQFEDTPADTPPVSTEETSPFKHSIEAKAKHLEILSAGSTGRNSSSPEKQREEASLTVAMMAENILLKKQMAAASRIIRKLSSSNPQGSWLHHIGSMGHGFVAAH